MLRFFSSLLGPFPTRAVLEVVLYRGLLTLDGILGVVPGETDIQIGCGGGYQRLRPLFARR